MNNRFRPQLSQARLALYQPVPGSQIVQCGCIKMSKAKIRRARLGKGGGGGEKNVPSQPPRVFSHFFLLNDFSPLSQSLEQANTKLDMKTIYIVRQGFYSNRRTVKRTFLCKRSHKWSNTCATLFILTIKRTSRSEDWNSLRKKYRKVPKLTTLVMLLSDLAPFCYHYFQRLTTFRGLLLSDG